MPKLGNTLAAKYGNQRISACGGLWGAVPMYVLTIIYVLCYVYICLSVFCMWMTIIYILYYIYICVCVWMYIVLVYSRECEWSFTCEWKFASMWMLCADHYIHIILYIYMCVCLHVNVLRGGVIDPSLSQLLIWSIS